MTNKTKAVFIVSRFGNQFCATTRPKHGEGAIGLPGGKVDPGENLFEAALREAEEEGWFIHATPESGQIIHQSENEKYELFWVEFAEHDSQVLLSDYKEAYRGIKPILVGIDEIASSGNGNEFLLTKY